MSRGRCSFRESDVRRAVRAIEATGKEIAAVEISAEGKIRIVVGKTDAQSPQDLANPMNGTRYDPHSIAVYP